MAVEGESTDELLAAARGAGFSVDRPKLARWHRAGLLPTPVQLPLGYGRGTRSIYPPGTKAQLIRLCELKAHRKKHDALTWMLWWEGWNIAPEKVRSIAAEVVAKWSGDWAALFEPDGTFTQEAEAALDRAHDAELPSHTLRQMRRRAGAENFDVILEGILRSMAGQEISKDGAADLVHAMGLDQAQTDSLPGTDPWLADSDPLDGLPVAKQFMNPQLMSTAIADMSDDDLRKASDTARGLVETFDLVGGLLQQTIGRWALGFGLLAAIAADARDDINGQIILSIFIHNLSAAGLEANAAQLIGSRDSLRTAHQGLNLMADVTAHLPEAADTLNTRRLSKAMRDPAQRSALDADIETLRQQFPVEIAAALERQGVLPEGPEPDV